MSEIHMHVDVPVPMSQDSSSAPPTRTSSDTALVPVRPTSSEPTSSSPSTAANTFPPKPAPASTALICANHRAIPCARTARHWIRQSADSEPCRIITVRRQPEARNTESEIKARREFVSFIQKAQARMSPQHIIASDEKTFTLYTAPRKARLPTGQHFELKLPSLRGIVVGLRLRHPRLRAVSASQWSSSAAVHSFATDRADDDDQEVEQGKNGKRGGIQSLHLYIAFSRERIFAAVTQWAAFCGADFDDIYKKALFPAVGRVTTRGRRTWYEWDGVSSHKAVEKLFLPDPASGDVPPRDLIVNPSHSPFLNPTESLFSIITDIAEQIIAEDIRLSEVKGTVHSLGHCERRAARRKLQHRLRGAVSFEFRWRR